MIAATSKVLHDGVRNSIMQFTGVSDGAGPETNAVKVDASELDPAPASLKVTKITYDVSGGVLRLSWAADDPVQFADLTEQNVIDYEKFGGLLNGGGDTANGDILFSTLGFEAGSSYSVTIEMVKKYAP